MQDKIMMKNLGSKVPLNIYLQIIKLKKETQNSKRIKKFFIC